MPTRIKNEEGASLLKDASSSFILPFIFVPDAALRPYVPMNYFSRQF